MDPYERLNAINEGIQRLRRIQKSLAKAEQGSEERVQQKVDQIVKSGGLNRAPGGMKVTRGDMVFKQRAIERNNPRIQGLKAAEQVAKDKLERRDNKKLRAVLNQQRLYKSHPDNFLNPDNK
mgnify:CR=1 FL=1|jgi:hypothetical protein